MTCWDAGNYSGQIVFEEEIVLSNNDKSASKSFQSLRLGSKIHILSESLFCAFISWLESRKTGLGAKPIINIKDLFSHSSVY